MNTKKILWICLAILGLGALVTVVIFSTEPEAQKEGATIETAILVDVLKVEKGTFTPTIVATGTVQAVEDINLSPLVSGQVIRRDPAFTPGGFVKKNQILLQIDPSDYKNTLALRNSELVQAQTTLDTEMGRQQIAEQDLQLIAGDSLFGDNPLSEEERQLVLRQPQLNAVEATINAANASVEQARLNLQRTTIRAPFDAHILSQNVTQGSLVSQGDVLGRLVGSEYYWINATVPVGKLKWLSFPNNQNEKGAHVRIENETDWAKDSYREGYLDKQIGALDGQTRLARVLVKVDDPLATKKELEDQPKLMIGTFVEVNMQGDDIKDVVKLNRDYVRGNETVWVMKQEKLEIRKVDIVLTDDTHAYIRSGLDNNDQVIITDLSTVSEGIALRTAQDKEAK
ncbi:efflux RND transporter periplasmic adaptor subunit [Formosa algae]|uniref:RND family efflux transporter MFP subunit n=1 Tax=Formosa algae TaxID=225843 RepID=A0A9X0YP81_9FLAO|nr:efflux RND transporter periplasmic adaptor subunit [Formosa algae]MBP1841528.1 RND family efflux transporter MFP subunit [Formosa algae]MDQ0337079.1 RND family efflux transporter MFP subunit [Formosa algae]OEI80131.1 efflux transporter periplasmic adaptor subunit [Formosa algae]